MMYVFGIRGVCACKCLKPPRLIDSNGLQVHPGEAYVLLFFLMRSGACAGRALANSAQMQVTTNWCESQFIHFIHSNKILSSGLKILSPNNCGITVSIYAAHAHVLCNYL